MRDSRSNKTGSIKNQNIQAYVTPELKAWYDQQASKDGWATSYLAGLVLENHAENSEASAVVQMTPALKQWCDQYAQDANYRNTSDLVSHALLNFAQQNGFDPDAQPAVREKASLVTGLQQAQTTIAETLLYVSKGAKKAFGFLNYGLLSTILILGLAVNTLTFPFLSTTVIAAEEGEDVIIILPYPPGPETDEEPKTT